MKIDMTRTYPVTRKECFAVLMDASGWPEWAPFRATDSEKRLAEAGDTMPLEYRFFGIPVTGEATLDEIKEPELIRVTFAFPGLPKLHETAKLTASGTKAAMLTIEVVADEPEHWFGASLQLMTLLPVLRRDMRLMLDRLHDRLLPAARTAA